MSGHGIHVHGPRDHALDHAAQGSIRRTEADAKWAIVMNATRFLLVLCPLLGACGGGSGDGHSAVSRISEENAATLANAVVNAAMAAEILAWDAQEAFEGPLWLSAFPVSDRGLPVAETPDVLQPGTIACPSGGTMTLTTSAANPRAPAPGDSSTRSFVRCTASLGRIGPPFYIETTVYDGRMHFVVSSFSGGGPAGSDNFYILSAQVEADSFALTVDGAQRQASGAFGLVIDSSGGPSFSSITLIANDLHIETSRIGRHRWRNASISISSWVCRLLFDGELAGNGIPGTVVVTTQEPLCLSPPRSNLFPGQPGPEPGGQFHVTGADSSLLVTVVDRTTLRLDIDTDGDDLTDRSFTVPYSEVPG